jgi:hypothetical protein
MAKRKRTVLGMGPDFIAQLQQLGGVDHEPGDAGTDANQEQMVVVNNPALAGAVDADKPGPVRMGTKMPVKRTRRAGTKVTKKRVAKRAKVVDGTQLFTDLVTAISKGNGQGGDEE